MCFDAVLHFPVVCPRDNLDVDKAGKSPINKLYIWEKGVSSAK